ncbi:hypothetical protein QBZ16_003181 [Prototheca wickerhamii]|uniref:Sugar phosphate transporter domain-containing protein n=1 Tax=Prototheca wickerhamii TaxID=3111 RepID=A0AAD9IIH9_PROWI|nr:hypothetical protein QBZ16_003181 [Prototheca wickerhamii]
MHDRVVACFQYGLVSVSITLFNRAVFSVYKFNYPAFFTMLQLIVSIIYILLLNRAKYLNVERLTLAGARKVMPLTAFWWLYVVSGMTALRYLNVPMYSVLRRATTLVVVAGEFYMFNKSPSRDAMVALMAMIGGAVVAGLSDVTYSGLGYFWVSICVLSTAAYLLLIRKLKDTGMNQHTLLLYNNVLALGPMLVVLLASDELPGVLSYPRLWEPQFVLFLLTSCSQAFLLNLCIFRCTLINSALATNVTGQMKDILTTVLGIALFNDVTLRALNLAGLALGLLGSMAYSLVSYREAKNGGR